MLFGYLMLTPPALRIISSQSHLIIGWVGVKALRLPSRKKNLVYILDIENKTGTKLPLKNSQEKETFLEKFYSI
jgi:hypothetical protein